MNGLVFAAPAYIHLLWLVVTFVGVLIWLERRGTAALERFAALTLLERLVARTSRGQRTARIGLLGMCGVFLVLAMMRPQWGIELVSTPRLGAEIMICLDVSKSMLAEDATPSRLGRAKADVADLLSYLDGDQVGLIAFAGRASVLSPLTPDFGFLRLALDNARPGSVSRGGTRLEEPIRKAVRGFGASADVSRSIILITDGEDHDSLPREAAKAAAERGIRILAVGIGDEAGSPLASTDPRTGAKRTLLDERGEPVISRLDGDLLRELALITDGAYIPAGTAALDLRAIFEQHIAPLTRGQLDGSTRTIRQDAYQWALLAAALCLLASTVVNARVPGTMLAVVVLTGLSVPDRDALAQVTTTPSETSAPVLEPPAVPPPPPDTSARTLYNDGLKALTEGDHARAGDRLERARTSAGTDAEVRLRATYALGTLAVQRADGHLADDPDAALDALREAASRYRDAVSLRPKAEDARYNLELIERRITELADSLNQVRPGDLRADLDKLIESQRSVLAEIGAAVQAAHDHPDANTTAQVRKAHRALSVRQLAAMDEARRLAERVQSDIAGLEKNDDAENAEQALRRAQLEGLGHFLHQARERLTRVRTRLRRVQTEAAYRRGAAALDALKEGRDQLLDPAQRLGTLLGEQRELTLLTLARAVTSLGPGISNSPDASAKAPTPSAPAWATDRYLSESQDRIAQRAESLRTGLASALERLENAPPDQQAPRPPANLASALPRAVAHLDDAVKALERAAHDLGESSLAIAVRSQGTGRQALADARELFLDLRGLIELTYQNQRQVAVLLSPTEVESSREPASQATPPTDGQDTHGAPPRLAFPSDTQSESESSAGPTTSTAAPPAQADIARRAARAEAIHARNLQRMTRLGEVLTDTLADLATTNAENAGSANSPPTGLPGETAKAGPSPEQQRLEQGYELWRLAQEQMHRASGALEAGPEGAPASSAVEAVDASLTHLENLRRLFFSLLEHLRETAQRQQGLNDDTEAHRVLAESEREQVGPLVNRQQHLGQRAAALAKALQAQAEQSQAQQTGPPSGPTPSRPSGEGSSAGATGGPEQAALLAEAGAAVTDAAKALDEASTALGEREFEPGRAAQDAGLAKLLEALAKLQPPPQPGEQSDQPQGQGEAQASEQNEQAGEDGQTGSQEQAQESRDETSSENLEQLLQQVREREAERRQRQAARSTRYAPVEKDW